MHQRHIQPHSSVGSHAPITGFCITKAQRSRIDVHPFRPFFHIGRKLPPGLFGQPVQYLLGRTSRARKRQHAVLHRCPMNRSVADTNPSTQIGNTAAFFQRETARSALGRRKLLPFPGNPILFFQNKGFDSVQGHPQGCVGNQTALPVKGQGQSATIGAPQFIVFFNHN